MAWYTKALKRTGETLALRIVLAVGCLVLSAQASRAQEAPAAGRPAQTALVQAAEYLWSQQGDDGGWHSDTYAVLRSGQALTPFVLHALLTVPGGVYEPPPEGVQRALAFLRRHINADGLLGMDDPEILEYPNYSTSLALRCFLLADQRRDREIVRRLTEALLQTQFREQNGFGPEHLAYGGWGFAAPIAPGNSGHMELAHTRHVLQALVASERAFPERPLPKGVRLRALAFLGLLQRDPRDPRAHPRPGDWQGTVESWQQGKAAPPDGGFYFSPIVLAVNKGGYDRNPPGWRSYATATCDGLLALLQVAERRDDPRVQAAVAWLAEHPDLDYPQGVPKDHPEPWGEAIRFYHYAVRAEVYRTLDWPGNWRVQLQRLLAARQQPGGSFVNRASHLMKEDDPLLATPLAALALAHAAAADP